MRLLCWQVLCWAFASPTKTSILLRTSTSGYIIIYLSIWLFLPHTLFVLRVIQFDRLLLIQDVPLLHLQITYLQSIKSTEKRIKHVVTYSPPPLGSTFSMLPLFMLLEKAFLTKQKATHQTKWFHHIANPINFMCIS